MKLYLSENLMKAIYKTDAFINKYRKISYLHILSIPYSKVINNRKKPKTIL